MHEQNWKKESIRVLKKHIMLKAYEGIKTISVVLGDSIKTLLAIRETYYRPYSEGCQKLVPIQSHSAPETSLC